MDKFGMRESALRSAIVGTQVCVVGSVFSGVGHNDIAAWKRCDHTHHHRMMRKILLLSDLRRLRCHSEKELARSDDVSALSSTVFARRIRKQAVG